MDVHQTDKEMTVTIKVKMGRSLLETERAIQIGLNEAGCALTGHALSYLDTDGSPIKIGNRHFTSKGQTKKIYETPYGTAEVARHVYQDSNGGNTFCPLDHDGRIVVSTTPLFANIISHKYSEMSASRVISDLKNSSSRDISAQFIAEVSNAVSEIMRDKEKIWSYELPIFHREITSVGISVDGTCALIRKDGWKQVMVGTISLYDKEGERMHTIYVGESPESGKHNFHKRFTLEIGKIKALYPKATYVGIADGAPDNWIYLNQFCDKKCIDFYHVSEYLARVAEASFSDLNERKEWFENSCHNFKNNHGVAAELISEMQSMRFNKKISLNSKDQIRICQTYFENHLELMNFAEHTRENLPIGSGVVEAACKTIVKQRLCQSGMRWLNSGARSVLRLRTMAHTNNRWEQFWNKIDQFGFKLAA